MDNKRTQDLYIRNVNKETVVRIDEKASKLGLDRSAYLRMFLDNMELESKISERTRILVEVLQVNNDLNKRVEALMEKIKERL